MAGKTGSAQVRHVSRALRESGHFNSMSLPWEYRPHALFICFAPYDNPRYAISIVVEHGNAGADEAAPLAKLIMTDTLLRDPSNPVPPSERPSPQADPTSPPDVSAGVQPVAGDEGKPMQAPLPSDSALQTSASHAAPPADSQVLPVTGGRQ